MVEVFAVQQKRGHLAGGITTLLHLSGIDSYCARASQLPLPILPEHVSVALVSVWTIHSEHTAIYCDPEIETFEKLSFFFGKFTLKVLFWRYRTFKI